MHAALIEQALANVLKMPHASPPQGRLKLSAGVQDNQLFFAVADEGLGIPEEERAKIFDVLHRRQGDRGGQGTGPGLAICQGMVGAHGGHISVADGIEGRGTCITLFLPLQAQPGLKANLELPSFSRIYWDTMSQTATILVIDDELQIRKFLRISLASQGYKVIEAGKPATRPGRPP